MYQKISQSWFKHLDFLILDAVIFQMTFFLSYLTRDGAQFLEARDMFQDVTVVLGLMGVILAIFTENYKDILRRGYLREFYAVVKMVAMLDVALIAYLFFVQRSSLFSRAVIIIFSFYTILLDWGARVLWKRHLQTRKIPVNQSQHVLVITTANKVDEVVSALQYYSFGRVEVMGIVAYDSTLKVGDSHLGVPVVTDISELSSYIQKKWVDEVLVSLPKGMELSSKAVNKLLSMGITIHSEIDVHAERSSMKTVEKIAGSFYVTESIRIASGPQMFFKRTIDIVGSLVGLTLTAILTLFIGPAIFITDPGPIFFAQERVGKNGRIFKMYKFRSMYRDAEERKKRLMEEQGQADSLMFKMENDPRILGSGPDGSRHGIGWLIRKTSLDEFPQFYNCLKGDLSLVGTRPPTVDEWEKYHAHHRARLAIKPGLTGLWQVSGRSRITDFEEVVKLDLKYINNWSISEDFKILAKTVKVMFTGDGAE